MLAAIHILVMAGVPLLVGALLAAILGALARREVLKRHRRGVGPGARSDGSDPAETTIRGRLVVRGEALAVEARDGAKVGAETTYRSPSRSSLSQLSIESRARAAALAIATDDGEIDLVGTIDVL